MKNKLLILFILSAFQIFAQQENWNIPVRFSAGAGFYYLKNENVSFLSFAVDFKRENKLSLSMYMNTTYHRGRPDISYNETNSQFGIGITKFSNVAHKLYFDPFVYAMYERRYLAEDTTKYFGLGTNIGFKTGYRFNHFAIGLSVSTSISGGRRFYYKDYFDKDQRVDWNYHFFAPTPLLTLSWTW